MEVNLTPPFCAVSYSDDSIKNFLKPKVAKAAGSVNGLIVGEPFPNKKEMEVIKIAGYFYISLCLDIEKIKQLYGEDLNFFEENIELVMKKGDLEFKSDHLSLKEKIIVRFNNDSGLEGGKYDLILRSNKTGVEIDKKLKSFEIIMDDNCIAVKPKGLENKDQRIPIVIVPQSDWQGHEEELEKIIDQDYSLMLRDNYYPASLDNYTLWWSKKLGENACKDRGNGLVVEMTRNKDDGYIARTQLGGSVIQIRHFHPALNYKGVHALVITHELGHCDGFLYDEYWDSPSGGSTTSSRSNPQNCAAINGNNINSEEERKKEACKYFNSKIKDLKKRKDFICDCNDVPEEEKYKTYQEICSLSSKTTFKVFAGCGLIPDYDSSNYYWYRSLENGVMFFSNLEYDSNNKTVFKNATFGPVGQSIYEENLKNR